jgi:anti-sigma B factor antagonist
LGESQHDLAPLGRGIPFVVLGGDNVEIEIRSLGDVKLIKLNGKITLGVAVDRLRETLDDLINAGASRFVLDLGEVPMIDSSGIGLLVRYLTTSKQRGGALKLLNPTKFAVQTLKMIGLLNLFEVFQDQGQALASFG